MKKLINYAIILFFSGLNAQEIDSILNQSDFDHINIEKQEKIYFEHQGNRDPSESFRLFNEILNTESFSSITPKTLILSYHRIPVIALNTSTNDFVSIGRKLPKIKQEKFQIRLHPNLTTRFGHYSDPYEIKLGLVIDTRIYLYKSLSFIGGFEVPIQNNLDPQSMKLRPAPSMFHYMDKIKQHNYLTISIGGFYQERYGFDMEFRHANHNQPISYGISSSYTGKYRFDGINLNYTSFGSFILLGDVEYRTQVENLTLKLSGGKWLNQDTGMRIDLIKQYQKAELGLYVSSTNQGSSTGFQMAFAFYPRSIFKRKKISVRPTEEFRYQYAYDSKFVAARRIRKSIPRLDQVLRQYKLLNKTSNQY